MSAAVSSATSTVHCPVCDAAVPDIPRHRYTSEQAAAHFCPPMRDARRNRQLAGCIERLWNGSESVVYFCEHCGFGFGYPHVGGDEEFYSLLHEQAGYPRWRWDYTVAIDRALSGMGGGRILDIGAGHGMFLRALDSRWERFAVESTPVMKAELEKRGFSVFDTLQEAVRRCAGSFTVVTMFQVLEHIASFRATLADCRRLLAAGGRLVISVPCAERVELQEKLTGCLDMTPNHINKWSPRSLALALRAAGFRPSEALHQPRSWRHAAYYAYLRTTVKAQQPTSLAARLYKVRRKAVRAPLLAMASLAYAIPMLPWVSDLMQGQSFVMIGDVAEPPADGQST